MNLFWASFVLLSAVRLTSNAVYYELEDRLPWWGKILLDTIGFGLVAYALWIRG